MIRKRKESEHMSSLFRKKDINDLVKHASPLKRTLKTWDLTFLGIGAIIGTGIFVLTGKGALTAGPALALSFFMAAICCGFAGLCYAEFASMAPVAGSAYTYSYIAFGEIIAFIIGWDLILEYALGAATVSVGWSGYFTNLLSNMGIRIPTLLTAAIGTTPGVNTIFNLPAFLIILVITVLDTLNCFASFVNDICSSTYNFIICCTCSSLKLIFFIYCSST